jgi:hypothetical protein
MAVKFTRLTHKIAIQLHLVAENFTICSSHSRRPVRKRLGTPSDISFNWAPRYEDLRGNRGIAPCILKLSIRWRWIVSFTVRPHYSQGNTPSTRCIGCGPQSRSGLCAVEKKFLLYTWWWSKSCRPFRRLVTIPTELPRYRHNSTRGRVYVTPLFNRYQCQFEGSEKGGGCPMSVVFCQSHFVMKIFMAWFRGRFNWQYITAFMWIMSELQNVSQVVWIPVLTLPVYSRRNAIFLLMWIFVSWTQRKISSGWNTAASLKTFSIFMWVPSSRHGTTKSTEWLRIYWISTRGQPTRCGHAAWGLSEGLTAPHLMKCDTGPRTFLRMETSDG